MLAGSILPDPYGHDFKVIVTNKMLEANRIVAFHEGRGSQESRWTSGFSELKTNCQMGYVPVRTRARNQLYLLAGLFAHNLACELQMATTPPARHTTAHRAAL